MKNDWEENTEISMTGHGVTNREAPDRSSQSYFAPPVLDPKDGKNWNPQKQNANTGNIHNHDLNSWNLNGNSDGENSGNSNNGNEKKRRKIIAVAITALVAVVLVFVFWPCSHEWMDATCTSAKICSKCGETEGAALGHNWKNATCTDPSVCTRCNAKSGAALGHKLKEIIETDFVESKVVTYFQCTVCKKKEDYVTSNLTTMLTENCRTFRIPPADFAKRLSAACSELGLNLTCSWSDQIASMGAPGIEVRAGSEISAEILFFEGEPGNLKSIRKNDKNKESAFEAMQIAVNLECSETIELLIAFIMASDPVCEEKPEIAVELYKEILTSVVEYNNIIYCMLADDGWLMLNTYAEQLLN